MLVIPPVVLDKRIRQSRLQEHHGPTKVVRTVLPRDDGQSGSQRAVIEACVKQGGSQSLDGDAVAVRSRDALGETTRVVGDPSGADLARLGSEQGSEVLAEIFVGDGPLDEEKQQRDMQQGLNARITEAQRCRASVVDATGFCRSWKEAAPMKQS
jgi:hypothetical protein